MTTAPAIAFSQLGLPPHLLATVEAAGYAAPSPIQAEAIPPLLQGRDMLGQAQTGTGKTAAFALPLLARLDPECAGTQVLVLTPTRELAMQVAGAFRKYAGGLPGLSVLPIYGGQDYKGQLQGLRRGAQVVVGTPGRVMDHLRRGTLVLENLATLVLDEADEMLRMGFIDDVQWILEQCPPRRQTALFSATMPRAVEEIARRHLREPVQVTIAAGGSGGANIRQRYWQVRGQGKREALARVLEAEAPDAAIVFVRTREATEAVAEQLRQRGHAASALNGDIPQQQRERTVERLRRGELDILVATDVAARGLDVERITHVINFDIPFDSEAYVHRIGRTGRAGRAGDAILFVAGREKRLLRGFEKATGQALEAMQLPSVEQINAARMERFRARLDEALQGETALGPFQDLVHSYLHDQNVPAPQLAAALTRLALGEDALLPPEDKTRAQVKPPRPAGKPTARDARKPRPQERRRGAPEQPGMERFRIEVGHDHQVRPGNIVGAIANEAELDSKHIGRIDIRADHSLVDLPEGMPEETFRHLRKAWVAGRRLNISRVSQEGASRRNG